MGTDLNLYDTILPDGEEFDVGMSTIGLMYDHLNFDEISKYFDLNQYNKSFPTDNDKILSIIHFNIRSLSKNGDEMIALLTCLKKQPDIIVISESFLDSDTICTLQLDGYNAFHVVRGDIKRGGVSIFTRNYLNTEQVEEYSFADAELEICTVILKFKTSKYIISGIYRPRFKYDNVKIFNKKITQMLKQDIFKKNKTILLGDFNINLLEHTEHRETSDYLNKMQSLNYLPLISRPTRFPEGDQNGRESLLDHIYTNFIHQSISGILHHKITDHLPIFLNMTITDDVPTTQRIQFRLITEESRQIFTRNLINVDWEAILIEEDINDNFETFFNKFKELYNRNFPLKIKNVSTKRINNPWITSGLLNSIRQKNQMFKDRKLGLVDNLQYNSYRNRLNALIRLTKRNYYLATFSNFKNQTKKIWQTINSMTKTNIPKSKFNSIIHDNEILTDPKDISDAFNDFFVNVARNLDEKLPPPIHDPLSYLRGIFPNEMQAPVVTQQDFFKIIKELKIKTCDVSDFSPAIIKENSHILAAPIVTLFNQSVRQGKFPSILKAARVIPIYKKGAKTDMNNYRPISLLNIFSKIFEKLMKKHLIDFIEANEILSPSQYGFQRGKSTEDALSKFSEMIYNQLDKSNHVLSIFVDFSKAFDTVPHDILLKKLEHYGVRGRTNRWFSDYLTNRPQSTQINNISSSQKINTLGVPQGSVLGPLLFLLFINDLPNVSQLLSTLLFADDATLSIHGRNPTLLIETANFELEKFYFWCIANRLTVNTLKTHFMLFSNRPPDNLPPLLIKSNFTYDVIKSTDEIKFLGVYYDPRMTFKTHCRHLTSRLARLAALLFRIKDFAPQNILKIIYHAHVSSILNYCNIIWSNTYDTHLNSVTKMQKRIIRNVTRSAFRDHTAPLFKETKILPIESIRKLSIATFIFKNQLTFPGLLAQHDYRTRRRDRLRPPIHRTSLFEKSFLYQAPLIWNELSHLFPPDVFTHLTANSFKNRIKKHLLEQIT